MSVRCYPEMFRGNGNYENPWESRIDGIFSWILLGHEHKKSAATNTFSLRKDNGTRKKEIFCMTFDCYPLNQALIGHGPEHYLLYEAQFRARADLQKVTRRRSCVMYSVLVNVYSFEDQPCLEVFTVWSPTWHCIHELPGIFLGTIPLISKTDITTVSTYSSLLISTD